MHPSVKATCNHSIAPTNAKCGLVNRLVTCQADESAIAPDIGDPQMGDLYYRVIIILCYRHLIYLGSIYAYLHTVANQQLANKRAPGAAITRTYIAHRILPLPIKDPRRQSKIGFRVWDPNISNAPPKNTLRLATEPAFDTLVCRQSAALCTSSWKQACLQQNRCTAESTAGYSTVRYLGRAGRHRASVGDIPGAVYHGNITQVPAYAKSHLNIVGVVGGHRATYLGTYPTAAPLKAGAPSICAELPEIVALRNSGTKAQENVLDLIRYLTNNSFCDAYVAYGFLGTYLHTYSTETDTADFYTVHAYIDPHDSYQRCSELVSIRGRASPKRAKAGWPVQQPRSSPEIWSCVGESWQGSDWAENRRCDYTTYRYLTSYLTILHYHTTYYLLPTLPPSPNTLTYSSRVTRSSTLPTCRPYDDLHLDTRHIPPLEREHAGDIAYRYEDRRFSHLSRSTPPVLLLLLFSSLPAETHPQFPRHQSPVSQVQARVG
ncbi:hypothetical protein CIB48_g10710 [Xylaria polymorpha]|nr:hypothetical protein CIB48_g10710 [Xylaria polymorpha]